MKAIKRELLIGTELGYAIDNNLPVFFMLRMHNPNDNHMNLIGKYYVKRTGDGNQIELFKDKNLEDSCGYSMEYWEPFEDCSYIGDEAVEEFYKCSKVNYS